MSNLNFPSHPFPCNHSFVLHLIIHPLCMHQKKMNKITNVAFHIFTAAVLLTFGVKRIYAIGTPLTICLFSYFFSRSGTNSADRRGDSDSSTATTIDRQKNSRIQVHFSSNPAVIISSEPSNPVEKENSEQPLSLQTNNKESISNNIAKPLEHNNVILDTSSLMPRTGYANPVTNVNVSLNAFSLMPRTGYADPVTNVNVGLDAALLLPKQFLDNRKI